MNLKIINDQIQQELSNTNHKIFILQIVNWRERKNLKNFKDKEKNNLNCK